MTSLRPSRPRPTSAGSAILLAAVPSGRGRLARRGRSRRPLAGAIAALLLAALLAGLPGRAEAISGTGGFVPLTPARILSTRDGIGDIGAALVAGGFYDQQILGRGSIPTTGVEAVVINVTVIAGGSAGFVTIYPSGGQFPPTSNVNFAAQQVVPNLVHVKVGSNGKVSIFNSAGTNHVIFDVAGYYTTAGRPDADGYFSFPSPERLFDSRTDSTFDSQGRDLGISPLTARDSVSIDVDDRNEIDAVALNVTAVNASAPTFVTLYPGGSGATRPLASNLNVSNRAPIANAVIVRLGADGSFVAYNDTGSVDVVLDIVGYYLKPTVNDLQSRFIAVQPSRVLSTRDGIGSSGKLTQTPRSFKITGTGGIPNSSTVTAVVLNVTATRPDRDGYLTVYPGGVTVPNASTLNFVAGQSVPNHAIVGVGAGGTINVFNSAGTTDVIYDVVGYFQSSTAALASIDDGSGSAPEGPPASPAPRFGNVRAIRSNEA